MLHDLQDLKIRLAASYDLEELMGDFLEFANHSDLLERSQLYELPPLLKTTLEDIIAKSLGRRDPFSGLTLRCGDIIHGVGQVAAAEPTCLFPISFVYAEDRGIGLVCISGLPPRGENRYTRFRHLPHRGGAMMN